MKVPTRYGLIGIGALSLLSLVHWVRDTAPPAHAVLAYLAGVIPNFAAGIAITFVLLSIWADQKRDATFAASTRAFVVAASISGLGLLGWELIQRSSSRFVFDLHDVGATLVGLGIAGLMFYVSTPKPVRTGSGE